MSDETLAEWKSRVVGDLPGNEVRLSGYRDGRGIAWMEAIHLPTGRYLGMWKAPRPQPESPHDQ